MHLVKTNGQTLSSQKLTITNGLLLKWNNQLEMKRVSNDVDYYLDYDKINSFYQKYERKILEINNQVVALRKKYFVSDETGKPVYEEALAGQKPMVKVKEGMTREGYQIEINELMGRVVV